MVNKRYQTTAAMLYHHSYHLIRAALYWKHSKIPRNVMIIQEAINRNFSYVSPIKYRTLFMSNSAIYDCAMRSYLAKQMGDPLEQRLNAYHGARYAVRLSRNKAVKQYEYEVWLWKQHPIYKGKK
jgi:hypothetical protein